jgi:hypothetical protein
MERFEAIGISVPVDVLDDVLRVDAEDVESVGAPGYDGRSGCEFLVREELPFAPVCAVEVFV